MPSYFDDAPWNDIHDWNSIPVGPGGGSGGSTVAVKSVSPRKVLPIGVWEGHDGKGDVVGVPFEAGSIVKVLTKAQEVKDLAAIFTLLDVSNIEDAIIMVKTLILENDRLKNEIADAYDRALNGTE